MFKKLRNRKYIKAIEEETIALAIIQGKIDYYEADAKIYWYDGERSLCAGLKLAKYYSLKAGCIHRILQLNEKIK